ncbi:hypothetical protein O9992_18235 [Vibrio lentus]|nr:hypothetical protein [Vibrio lentus]
MGTVGDTVDVKQLGKTIIKTAMRPNGVIGRWGGEKSSLSLSSMPT